MYRKIIILLLTVIAVGTLSSYSLNEFHYGHKLNTLDASAVSMGNTGTAGSSNPLGITLNAINALNQNKTLAFETTINANKIEDKRSFPMYNFFDSYINESTYTAQENIFYNIGVAVTSKYEFDKYNRLGVGFYMIPKYSFAGGYDEEVRNNGSSNDDAFPAKIAINKIDNEGAIYAYGLSLAYQYSFDNLNYLRSLALGANVEMLDGNAESTKTIRFTDWAHDAAGYGVLADLEEKYDRDLSGIATQFSMNYEVNHRATFAFVYNPTTTIEVDATNKLNTYLTYADSTQLFTPVLTDLDSLKIDNMLNDYDLPSSYKVAFQLRPRNVLKTTFNVEAELVRWSETNDLFEDKFNYYLGIEHKFIETVPVRLGFSSTNSYDIAYDRFAEVLQAENGSTYTVDRAYMYAVEMMTPTVSLGTGFEFSKSLRADIGFSYSFRKFETLDLFMDEYYINDDIWLNSFYLPLTNRDWSNPDTVKENIFDFMFSLTLDL